MIWVILTALVAVCGATKLDANQLAPISSRTAGGNLGDLIAPLDGSKGLPSGSYANDAQGVVVDAASPGTRTSGVEPTGLGGPRASYGSKDSKVGDAAFGVSGFARIAPEFASFVQSNERQAGPANGNALKFASGLDNFSFETDNGISVGSDGSYNAKKDEGDSSNSAGSINQVPSRFGSQPQGPDNSYYYDKPSKPLTLPTVFSSGQYNNQNSQFVSQSSQFGSKPSTQFGQQTSTQQFGQASTSQTSDSSLSPTQQGLIYQNNKPAKLNFDTRLKDTAFAQATASSGKLGQVGTDSKFETQQSSSQFGSSGSQFGQNSQSTFGSGSISSTGKPIGSTYPQTLVGSKPQTTQQSSITYTQSTGQTSQFGKKPVSTTQFGTSGSQFGQNSQFGSSGSQFGQNSQLTFGSGSVSSTAKPIGSSNQQTQSGFSGSQFSQSPQSLVGSGSISSTGKPISSSYQQTQVVSKPQTTQQSSFTYTQSTGQTSQFGKKPVTTTQFGTSGAQFGQNSQFGSSGSQFGQNSQSAFGSGSVSSSGKPIGSTYQQTLVVSKPQTTQQSSFTYTQSTGQTSQFGKKPVSTTQFGTSGSQFGQNSQFGSSGSQFGQNSQLTFGSGSVSSTAKPISSSYQQTQVVSKPQTTQQSSFTYTQSTGQTSQFGKKPVSTTQFGTSGSQFGQNSQFGSSGSQFGQNSQSAFGSGSVSSTGKPISSTYQQTQVVSKPQTTQQSSFTYTQSTGQTSQFGKKPVSPTPFGTSGSQFGQNSQFGSYGSQFGQNYQSTYGSGSVLSTGKPVGSTYPQTQVVSKPQTTQQSSFTYAQSTGQNSQFGKKPVSTSQFGTSGSQFGQNSQFGLSGSQAQNSQSAFGAGSVSSTAKPIGSSNQQTQSGLSGSQFSQSSQSTFGSGSVSSTGKPISSTYQQTQVVSKPQTTQQSSYTYTQSTGQTSQLSKKPASTAQFGSSGTQFGQNSQFGLSSSQFGQNSQFGLSGSQLTQNSQSASGAGSVSSTAKPIGSSYQQTQSGLSGSQFSQSSQSSFGSGSVSSTGKPISSTYQQTQVVSKPQTTQQSSYTYTQSTGQTSQLGNKPARTAQFGSSGTQFGQNSQFGLSGSQAQNSQSAFGAGSVSSTAKPIGFSSQQTQSGLSGSQFSHSSQSTFGSGSVSSTGKPISSTYQQTQVVSKPQQTQQSSFTSSQSTSQTSQFGKKPVSTTPTRFGTSGSQFGQSSQFGSYGSQFGQNYQSTYGSGSVFSTVKPIGSTYPQTQVVSKPQTTQQSSLTYAQSTGQTSQLGKKPVSTAQFGTSGTQFGQNSQFGVSGSQFGQNSQFGLSNSQLGQNSQSAFGSGSVSSTAKPSGSSYQTQSGLSGSQFSQSSQSSFGSGSVSSTGKPISSTYQQTQVVSKPQTIQQSSYTYTQSTGQTSQFGKKPVSTTPFGTSGQFGQNSQFGLSGSQGQNSQSSFGAGSVSSTAKPIGFSNQQTQSGLSGSQFSHSSQSTFGSGSVSSTGKPISSTYQQTQVVSKPQTTQQSSYTYTQSTGQTSQLGKKPASTAQFGSSGSQFDQNSQLGLSGSQFSQNSQSTFGSGSVSSTVKPIDSTYQQTQIISKPQTTQQSSITYAQSTGQTSQLGKKPASTAQFGTSGTQFGQNSQSAFGSGSLSSTAKPISSSYQQSQVVSKPQTSQQSSFTSSQFTSQTSQFGKKPVSTTQFETSGSQFGQNSQFGSSGSQFGQNSQSTFGTGSVSSTLKPISSSYQQTQIVSKPQTTQQSSFAYTQSTGQTSQLDKKPVSTTQFGSSTSQFNQNSQFGSSGSQFGNTPVVGTQQIQLGSESQFGQNSQSTLGSGLSSSTSQTSFGIKPVYQQAQFGSSGSQFSQGQTSQFGKKPVSTTTTGVASQQTQFESSGSQFAQKPVTTTVSGVTSSTGQSSFVQKPSSSGSSFYQQSEGTRFGQKPQGSQSSSYSSNTGSTDQIVQTTQFGVAGSSQNSGSSFQQTQSAGSSGSQIDQTVQTTQLGIKPVASVQSTQGSTQFGLTPSRFGETSQTIVPISTISQNVEPLVGQKPSQVQFGSSTAHFGQKPQAQVSTFASSSNPNVAPFSTTQTGQVSQYETSQFGVQNKGVVSSTQKPLGSSLSQTNSQEYQYTQTADKSGSVSQFGKGSQSNVGSSQGSAFQVGQIIGGQSTQGNVQSASVTGFNKPQSVFDQKVQQSQTSFNSAVSTSQTPISSQPLKPLGLSSTQATFLQSSSSQFGAVKPTVFSGPIIQTSYNQFSGKGSNIQGQSSAVASSQFGALPTPSTELSSFSGRPEYSIIPSQGFDYNPGVFSSSPSTSSRLGLNVDVTKVSSQTPAVIVPGYELVFNQGSSSFVGVGEEFGGPRDPPRFDDKTGYYY